MKIGMFYKVLSLFSVLFGAFLLLNSQVKTMGAVIGIKNLTSITSIEFGLVFLFLGVALFLAIKNRNVENKHNKK